MIITYAAGAVVVSDQGNILVVNQNGTSWSLPKGHIDEGETEEQAAVRETKEESGLTELVFVKKLGTYQRFRIGIDGGEEKSEFKNITMFLCTAKEVELRPNDPDNPEARWEIPDKAVELLTHPRDKLFLKSVLPEIKKII